MKPIPPSFIVETVIEELGADPDEVLSDRRSPFAVFTRRAIAYLCRELSDASFPEIMVAMQKDRGGHSAAAGYDRAMRELIALDPTAKARVESLALIVRGRWGMEVAA
jgi:chromosomal replication initiation ATPase DnaA